MSRDASDYSRHQSRTRNFRPASENACANSSSLLPISRSNFRLFSPPMPNAVGRQKAVDVEASERAARGSNWQRRERKVRTKSKNESPRREEHSRRLSSARNQANGSAKAVHRSENPKAEPNPIDLVLHQQFPRIPAENRIEIETFLLLFLLSATFAQNFSIYHTVTTSAGTPPGDPFLSLLERLSRQSRSHLLHDGALYASISRYVFRPGTKTKIERKYIDN